VGTTHDVAFAADSFGGIHKLPKGFEAYEELARKVENKYVRGWVAKNGSRMFLWDDFDDVLTNRTGHFGYLERALVKLRGKGYARPETELWYRGGERYVGRLGELALLADRLPAHQHRGRG
jgi:hypothetical protein